MSRRSFVVAIGFLAFLAGVIGSAAMLLVRYEPQYYAHAPLIPGVRSKNCSQEFCTEFADLVSSIGGDREWGGRFTDEQINSYLNEDFVKMGLRERLLPEGISDPRVVFEPDRIHLAFRLRKGVVCTVISMDMKVWLAESEPNVVAVQLEGFRAGVLPIAAQWLLETLSEVGRQNGIDVNWYRHEGHPVALLRFQADQPRTTLLLQGVKIEHGVIIVHGRATDPTPLRIQTQVSDGSQKTGVN